jgi:hypothetical protein
MMPEPSGEDVQNLYNNLTVKWSNRFFEEMELRDLVHQRSEIEVLEKDEERNIQPIEFHSGRAGGIIEHAAGLLMAMPSWSMERRGLGPEAQEDADSTEKVTAKVFQQQVLATDFWSQLAKDILIYGRGFLKALPLPSVWTPQAGYPTRKKNEPGKKYLARIRDWKATEGKFPFVINHVPTLDILPLLDGSDNVIASIEVKKVVAGVLADKTGMNSATVRGLISSGAIKWWDELLVLEYIDTEYVKYFLASTSPTQNDLDTITEQPMGEMEPLRSWKHGLGKCPVVMFSGIKTEVKNYEDHFKSFLADAKESLERYDFLLSRLATMVGAYYLPSYVLKLAESSVAAGGKERPTFKTLLGGTTVEYSDEDLRSLDIPQNLPDAERLITEVDDLIQRHTIEDVLFGRVQGSAPAFQVNLRINVARSKLTPISTHMAQGITNVMELFYRGVEQLGESVVIDGETITVKMAKGAKGRMTASIEPKGPIDRAQDIQTAKMYGEFRFPWAWIVENILGVDNPSELNQMRSIEELELLPAVQEAKAAKLLQHLELLEEESGFEELGEGEGSAALQAAIEQMRGGLGRGPFAPGGSPQATGRGLLSENEQPQPGTAEVGSLPIG